MSVADLLSKGLEFQRQSKPKKAERLYRQVLASQPRNFDALYLIGLVKAQQGDLPDAIRHLSRAVEVDATSAAVWYNLGNVLKLAGGYAEAVDAFEKSIAIERSAHAYAGLGDAHRALRQTSQSVKAYSASLELAPNSTETLSVLIEAKRALCDWRSIEDLEQTLLQKLGAGGAPVAPFILLNVVDDPELHHANALAFTKRRFPEATSAARKTSRKRDKIRVGYFSGDFREHATAYLAARLFELHDRSQFEVIAVSHGPKDRSPMRRRLEAAFDRFLDLSGAPTPEMLPRVASLDLDIAIDLNGHTNGGKLGLFASRVAPIQVQYLGYPGTMGARFFDYAMVDRFVVPEDERAHHTEALVHLPASYQVNDATRVTPAGGPSRQDAGLPDEAFVFCCFNTLHKITPATFAAWVRILEAVPQSVLWLMETSDEAARNLREEAGRRGLEGERLLFAPQVSLTEHLARHRLADLFLDTLPYNAHTTASDALWMGVPIVTCPGRAFAGRVAGSLLHAVGLPELIAPSMAEYAALAIGLAHDRDRLAEIRAKLARNRLISPLFDSGSFCRHFEAALRTMWDRHCRGLAPEGFVAASTLAFDQALARP